MSKFPKVRFYFSNLWTENIDGHRVMDSLMVICLTINFEQIWFCFMNFAIGIQWGED